MKLYVCLFAAMLAMAGPAHALLGAKLALLGALSNSFGGGDYGNGGGGGGGYGGGGYGGNYGRSYGNGGYGGYGISNNRPVYTGQSSNYGWGQRSYGGGYSSGYNGGYYGGNDDYVRIIKVIVNHEQPENYYNNYARGSLASSVSSSSAASWTPIPAAAPIPQTYAVQPAQSIQLSAPSTTPILEPAPVQNIQVSAPSQTPLPIQTIQAPARPVYVQSQPQPVYQQLTVQRPIQYPQQQPQPIFRQTQAIPQQSVGTIKLIVDGNSQHIPAVSYGPPVPAPNIIAPSVDNSGAWNSDSWSNANSGNGWNNIGSGPWKTGGIWESMGC